MPYLKTKEIYQNHAFVSVPIRIRLLPLIIMLSWLLFTVFLFVYGPYEYDLSNKAQLYTYLTVVHIMLCLGYFVGMITRGQSCKLLLNGPKMAKTCLYISFFIFVASMVYTKGGDIGRLKLAMEDPAAAYISSSTREVANIFNYISIFTAPIATYSLILCVFYWPLLQNKPKLIYIIFLIVSILGSIGSSTRAGIISVLLVIFPTVAVLYYGKLVVFNLKKKVIILTMIVIILCSFFYYTSHLVEKRGGATNMLMNPITLQMPDQDNFIYKIIPEGIHNLFSVSTWYITHGYARLASAMELPFIGIGFGIGNSYFLIRNAERLTGIDDLGDLSYGLRIDEATTGSFGLYWSTIYTWIASDFTFVGSVFIIYIIGYLFAISWIDSIVWYNPLAVAAFGILTVLIYSFPLNNPLQDGSGVAIYFVIISCWLFTRHRKVRVK